MAEPTERSLVADQVIQERMRATLELYEVGEQMMRQRLIREDPTADPAEIERRLVEWLHTRPGAEHGDASGPGFVIRSLVE